MPRPGFITNAFATAPAILRPRGSPGVRPCPPSAPSSSATRRPAMDRPSSSSSTPDRRTRPVASSSAGWPTATPIRRSASRTSGPTATSCTRSWWRGRGRAGRRCRGARPRSGCGAGSPSTRRRSRRGWASIQPSPGAKRRPSTWSPSPPAEAFVSDAGTPRMGAHHGYYGVETVGVGIDPQDGGPRAPGHTFVIRPADRVAWSPHGRGRDAGWLP